MNRLVFSLIFVALALSGCLRHETKEVEARQIADKYFVDRYHVELRFYDVSVKPEKNVWVVTYSPRGLALGGRTTLDVDRRTGKVVGERGEQ